MNNKDTGRGVPLRRQDALPRELQVRQVEDYDLREGRVDLHLREPSQASLHEAQRVRRYQLLQDGGT